MNTLDWIAFQTRVEKDPLTLVAEFTNGTLDRNQVLPLIVDYIETAFNLGVECALQKVKP